MSGKITEKYFSAENSQFLCRAVFTMILIHLIFSAFANTLVHQLQSPVLKFAYVDPTFWVMHFLHIPEFISSNYFIAWVFDVSLFICCITALFFPGKKSVIALFIILYFVYYIIFNSFGAHHTHALIPVLIAPVPFLFSKKTFLFSWEALRYFLLFSYVAAFSWKFFRFSWLNHNQGVLIIKKNLAPYLYFNPDTFLSKMYTWFLNNPAFTNTIFIGGFLMEGFFIIGFFTKKFDRLLFAFSVILPFGFWFFADALFFEQVIFSLTLLTIYPNLKVEKNKLIMA